MKCAILMDNGFEELEAMGPIALLRRGGVDVDVVSVEFWRDVLASRANGRLRFRFDRLPDRSGWPAL